MHPAYNINEAAAKQIWRVLVDVCGAYNGSDGVEETCFVFTMALPEDRNSREYRFSGDLGFGGKFWVNHSRWYVNCYPEDQSPRRLVIIEKANERLSELLLEHQKNNLA